MFSQSCVKNSEHGGRGVCMVKGGMCDRGMRMHCRRGHAWQEGACMAGEHVW